MKSVLYIGATLMVGACIYGFVDYKNTNRKEAFKSLYHQKAAATKSSPSPEQVAESKIIEKTDAKVMPAEVKKAVDTKTAGTKRKVTRNKKLNLKKYSRAALEKEEVIWPDLKE